MSLLIIFCEDPLQAGKSDSVYAAEVVAAESTGLKYTLINFETLVYNNDAQQAVHRVAQQSSEIAGLYRGWMLKPHQYDTLYQALLTHGIRLLNSPAAYKHCHYLPESYVVIEGQTPRTIWLETGPDVAMPVLMEQLSIFGDGPVIVKDFVKSQKHYWHEACYIPSASDAGEVERVVGKFLELQGDDLNGGLVFREYVNFEPLATHSRSGMPLTKEFRLFFLDGEPVYATAYWEEGDYTGLIPPVEEFQAVARRVQSKFFTMDIAKRADGDWLIVELGDGQVAGLPDTANLQKFYASLAAGIGT